MQNRQLLTTINRLKWHVKGNKAILFVKPPYQSWRENVKNNSSEVCRLTDSAATEERTWPPAHSTRRPWTGAGRDGAGAAGRDIRRDGRLAVHGR